MAWKTTPDGNHYVLDGRVYIAGGNVGHSYTITLAPPGGVGSINYLEASIFSSYSPKSDGIKAVKLTKDNLRTVAAEILKTVGGTIDVRDDHIVLPYGVVEVGQWLVEEYNYSDDKATFRIALLDERKKYDLR